MCTNTIYNTFYRTKYLVLINHDMNLNFDWVFHIIIIIITLSDPVIESEIYKCRFVNNTII